MQPQHDEQLLAFWQKQLRESSEKPWLAGIMLKQSGEISQRYHNFYTHLRALPRRWRRVISRKLSLGLAGAALLLALSGSAVPRAHAASIVVDETSCTLADAITAANDDTAVGGCAAGSGADTLTLQANVNLTSALPDITSPITLEANGRAISRVAGSEDFSILRVIGGDLVLKDATISGGSAVSGGGIHVYEGTLFARRTTISGNSAEVGGGIYGYGGSITVLTSTISGNSADSGAGVFGNEITTSISRSTISGNMAATVGGGFYMNFGQAVVFQSTISGNSAETYGGGMANVDGIATVSSSTISNNSAVYYGGGIYNAGYDAALTLKRSIISGNNTERGAEIDNLEGNTITSDNFNVVGYGGSARSEYFTPAASSDVIPDEPLNMILGPLAMNGGLTATHALPGGSPAVDLDTSSTCPATDQRSALRTLGRACDSGAYEYLVDMTQNISLVAGWNIVSLYIQPNSPTVEQVMSGVENDLVLMKNANGDVYWPAYGVNQIGNWQSGAGYRIHMNAAAQLAVVGKQFNPALNSTSLEAGWNTVAYLRESAMPVGDALSSISGELHIVKDGDGRIYWPSMGITNDLVDMEPGQAYQIYMNDPAELTYPGN